MGTNRFDMFLENHIGVGIRWMLNCGYPLILSISIMCVTFNIGFGKRLY